MIARIVGIIFSGWAVFFLLAGCGVALDRAQWTRPAGTESQFQKDSYECEMEARSVAGTGGRETFGLAQKLAERCMTVRGYTKG